MESVACAPFSSYICPRWNRSLKMAGKPKLPYIFDSVLLDSRGNFRKKKKSHRSYFEPGPHLKRLYNKVQFRIVTKVQNC